VKKLMISLVEKTTAEDQYEAHGVMWARRPQKFYSEALGVSLNTIGRYIATPPFAKKVESVEGAVRSHCSELAMPQRASPTITPSAS